MFEKIKDFLTLDDKIFKTFVFCGFVFLIWQVTNHLPTQISEVKTKIDKLEIKVDNNHKEVRTEIKDLSSKIDNNQKEINQRFDKLYQILLDKK